MRLLAANIDNAIYPTAYDYYKEMLPGCDLSFTSIENESDSFEDIEAYVFSQKYVEEKKQKLSPTASQVLKSRVECGITQIETDFPLLQNEQLITYEYSYFKDPFRNISPNTPFIKRITNISTVYFVFDDAIWNNNRVDFIVSNYDIPQKPYIPNSIAVASLLADLGLAALKGFMGKVGAAAFDKIFGSDLNHFDTLYKDITKIIRSELAEAKINEVQGKLSGVLMYVKNTYNPRKSRGGVPKDQLSSDLKPYYDQMHSLSGILMNNYYNKAGFSVFMACAYELIILAQELAYVDPYRDNPMSSSYVESIKKYADDFSAHAKNIMPLMMNDRKSHFYYKKYSEGHVVHHDVVVTYYYIWYDGYTGQKSGRFESEGKSDNPEQRCKNEMAGAQNSAAEELKRNLKYDDFIRNMTDLKNKPLPQ